MAKTFRDRVNYFSKNMTFGKSSAMINVHVKQQKNAENGKKIYNKVSLPKDVRKALILSSSELPMNYWDRESSNVRKANAKLKKKLSQIERRRNKKSMNKEIDLEINDSISEMKELMKEMNQYM